MSSKRILLLFVAIFAGGIAAFLAVSGQKEPVVQQVAQVEKTTTKVLVTNRTIGLGQRIASEDLVWQKWPKDALRPEYITEEQLPDAQISLAGVVVRFEIFAGEPVREEKIVRTDQGYLSAVIGPGLRAVSIRISPESGAGGFIVPNDRVDVILTSSTSQGDQTNTILENVRVLAIGLRLGEGEAGEGDQGQDSGSKTFAKKTTATVELAPAQAEKIIQSEQIGTLSLALRSVSDFAEHAKSVGDEDLESANQVKLIRFGQEKSLTVASISPTVDEGVSEALSDPSLSVPNPVPELRASVSAIPSATPAPPPPQTANPTNQASSSGPPPPPVLE